VVNRSAIKGCTDILLQLDNPTLYKRVLEPAVLRETESFYKAEGKRLIESCDGPQYLKKVCTSCARPDCSIK
jgi:cullin 3